MSTCTKMMGILPPLIVFAVYLPILITKADNLSQGPDFYHVDYTNSDFPNLRGFCRKEYYRHNGKPVYQKPRINYYLYVDEDDNWTVGMIWTSTDPWMMEGLIYLRVENGKD